MLSSYHTRLHAEMRRNLSPLSYSLSMYLASATAADVAAAAVRLMMRLKYYTPFRCHGVKCTSMRWAWNQAAMLEVYLMWIKSIRVTGTDIWKFLIQGYSRWLLLKLTVCFYCILFLYCILSVLIVCLMLMANNFHHINKVHAFRLVYNNPTHRCLPTYVKFTTLRFCHIVFVYLQHGGSNYCRQKVSVSPHVFKFRQSRSPNGSTPTSTYSVIKKVSTAE